MFPGHKLFPKTKTITEQIRFVLVGVYEAKPLHSLKMNTSEMEVSVHYKDTKGKEDVFHLPLKNLKKSGKMYNHGSISCLIHNEDFQHQSRIYHFLELAKVCAIYSGLDPTYCKSSSDQSAQMNLI